MAKYSMIVSWSEEDNCYIVAVPDLPGCMADGKTPQEAVENAQIIISEWIETAEMLGRKIPDPLFNGKNLTSFSS
ncbi:MAG: type II toxin-antitoxin system HicB family antitoxin [Clostridiales bacterium]|nr:type II toxin-antitoxin system HicB family antitoxin [Clostridiales bacterium]